jgi:putative Holliday junction resolvase
VSAILGIDLGDRRIGLAIGEGDPPRAVPLTTVPRRASPAEDARALAEIIEAHDVGELVVGLPFEASGVEGHQAAVTRAWAEVIARDVGLPLTYHDERLTSHVAEGRLSPMKRGRSGGPPSAAQRRAHRERIDRVAASIFLQDELDDRARIRHAAAASKEPEDTTMDIES